MSSTASPPSPPPPSPPPSPTPTPPAQPLFCTECTKQLPPASTSVHNCFDPVTPSPTQLATTTAIKDLATNLPRQLRTSRHNYETELKDFFKTSRVDNKKITKTLLIEHARSLGFTIVVTGRKTLVATLQAFAADSFAPCATTKLVKVDSKSEVPRPPLYSFQQKSLLELAQVLGCTDVRKQKIGLITTSFQGEELRERAIQKIKSKHYNSSAAWPLVAEEATESGESETEEFDQLNQPALVPAQFEEITNKKRKKPTKELSHVKRAKIAKTAWQTTGSTTHSQPTQIAKQLFKISETVGNAAAYSYYEAYFEEGSDHPYKVVFVSSTPLFTNPKQLNTLQFILANQGNPDKLQMITSQDVAQNKSDTQNLSIVKRTQASPPRVLPKSSRTVEASSSEDEDEE